MLVLDARTGDIIHIGDNITVAVLRDAGTNKLKLGFTAPKDVVILRDKVKARMEKEREAQ